MRQFQALPQGVPPLLVALCVTAVEVAGLIEEELSAYAYFGKSTAHGTPQSVARYVNVSSEEFQELALSGRPFILEDGGKEQPFVGWTCEDFRQSFPNGVVKVEYVRGVKSTWSIKDPWEKQRHAIPSADPNGPQYAPWYWGVKGAEDEEERSSIYQGSESPLPKVQSMMRIPPFMHGTQTNKHEITHSPEFWFSMPKAGAAMHMDAHCESTFAIQLSGTRKWRLGWVPPVPNGTMHTDGTYADGAVYGRDYEPPLEAIVSQGQALFMPSGFLHETSNIGDTCAVSMTFQFAEPMPARYFRHSLRHLRRTGDFNECWKLIGLVAGLQDSRNAKVPKTKPKLAAQDKDKDGRWSTAEAPGPWRRAAHAFHDTDQDGDVTPEELDAGWEAWLAADAEGRKKLKKTRPLTFAYVTAPREGDEL